MEMLLRRAFCGLVGSKFAAVVAGGQGADWLIQQCRALTGEHHAVSNGSTKTIRIQRFCYSPKVLDWTSATIRATANELMFAGMALSDAVEDAVGEQMMLIGEALGWEVRARS